MTRIHYDLSPAVHIAEAKVVELPSGISLAKFLMVFLNTLLGFEHYFSSMLLPCCMALEKMCM